MYQQQVSPQLNPSLDDQPWTQLEEDSPSKKKKMLIVVHFTESLLSSRDTSTGVCVNVSQNNSRLKATESAHPAAVRVAVG